MEFLSAQPEYFISLASRCPQQLEIISPRLTVEQYQVYIVEQWVPERNRPVKAVVAFTGDKQHKMVAGKFLIKGKLEDSEELAAIWKQHTADKARSMDTAQGKVLVTNIGGFSSSYNLILVPDGDYEAHIKTFHLNLNLRRLSCSSRSSLGLLPPSDAQRDRFFRIFHLPSTTANDLISTVLGLVRLIQFSLNILGRLPGKQCSDGLLCNLTGNSLKQYAADYGPFVFEDSNAFCEPPIFAAIVGKILSLRNKLNATGAQTTKDPFNEPEALHSSIVNFQKTHKLEITGLFDELTANKIEEIYAKSSPPGLKVHKVMKSSKAAAVDEKSGNHHHHVIELETTDIEFLFRHAHAEILRFIWGKKQQKQSAADAIIEAAMTEGLLQGGKQLGKNLLKKAAPRLPKENAMMRGIKENVAESLSKFSNQVEEFVERKRHTKAKRGLSKSKTDLAGNLRELAESDPEVVPEDPPNNIPNSTFVSNNPSPNRGTRKHRSYSANYAQIPVIPNNNGESKLKRTISISILPEFNSTIDESKSQTDFDVLRAKNLEINKKIGELKNLSNAYADKINFLSEVYVARWQGFSDIERALNDLIEQHKGIEQRIEKLQQYSSRLQYELSVYEDKMKETEEIMDNFRSKAIAMDDQVTHALASITYFDLFSAIKGLFVGQ